MYNYPLAASPPICMWSQLGMRYFLLLGLNFLIK